MACPVSALQLRAMEKELGAAITFAVRHRPEAPLSAVAEQLSRHLPAANASAAVLQADIVRLQAQVKELTLENERFKRGPVVQAALQAENTSLHTQVKNLALENERLKHGSSVQAGPGEEAAASPEIQKLRERVQATLAKLETAQPSTAVAGTTSLPEGLKDFTPLAKEPEIETIAVGLHEPELAVAQNLGSEAALEALRVETDRLALATQAKIEERTAEAKSEKLVFECAAAILAGNRDFQKIYNAVYDVISGGEAGSMEAAMEDIRALGQAVRGDPKQLQQRGEAAETATLLADAAGALPAFAELVRCLSWATGAR